MTSNNKYSKQLVSKKVKILNGSVQVPGDKSISHRSLMLGAITVGETIISGLLEGEDVLNTATAMREMGAKITCSQDGLWRVHGVGIGGLKEPEKILDMGNSGTSTRLLMGLVAGHDITATFTGDASLIRRPMKRVVAPLEMMGASILSRSNDRLPLTIRGASNPLAIEYKLAIASAQVKSAIILAGLSAIGTTTVIEDHPTRDHTENLLRHFGLNLETKKTDNGAYAVCIKGQQELKACAVDVPGDPSSAAFLVVAAVISDNSEIRIENVGLNPRRDGVFTTLIEMGADIKIENKRIQAGELVGTLIVRGGKELKGVTVPEDRVPSMIDEFPVLAVAAACANGKTYMTGLKELRVKESDRLLMIANGLKSCGVDLEMGEDSLIINGKGLPPIGGAMIETALDHRIAMSFIVLGTVTQEAIIIDDSSPIATSFPNFVELMNELGADISSCENNFESGKL